MCDLLLATNWSKFASLPDLEASASSLSTLDSSSTSSTSQYSSYNSSLSSNYSIKQSRNPYENSGFFKKKQAKAVKKIQPVVRGFLVRLNIQKAPILAELADVQRRKQEELERIEMQKLAEMEAFRQEMEREYAELEVKAEEAKRLTTELKEEKNKYEQEQATLKKECKIKKKANKELKKDSKVDTAQVRDLALIQHRVANLERQKASREETVNKYKQVVASHEERLDEVEEACKVERDHTLRLKVCISGIFDLVEPKSDSLTKKLLKITGNNQVLM
ncbi:expressed unknown protein [Seminavis robusta]|uniref:Uncharacterized protein n=1 Tax=Seminavis robusta TaxID=568900 RepID=A0A9N8HPD9_9STRA|nr:expressed unknown protein [Seminavis robusta]|eukprot:Sro1170_g248750.1 n/a (277) ;mRNA; f:24356-25186